jgi:D-alanine-D-alanine ligase
MTRRLNVAVLFGGRSVEHEVSLRSARTVIDALRRAGHDPTPVAVTRDGAWMGGERAEAMLAGAEPGGRPAPSVFLLPDPKLRGLATPSPSGAWDLQAVDVVFPLIHGVGGEDGTLQGLLDLAGLPYVGSGVAASALGMSKRLQRRLFREAGLPVLETVEVHREDWQRQPEVECRRILDGLGVPCFVKPSGSGSSVGVGKAHTAEELDALIGDAALYDEFILVEPARAVREVECAVLGNREPVATGPGEIVPEREFYDYRAKYLEDTTRLLIPAPLEAGVAREAGRLAVEAFRCLDCAGLARVDFFVEREGGTLWINEVNTLPGFTSISMYPLLWAAQGLALPELVNRLLGLALERHDEVSKSRRVLSGLEG